MILFKLAIWTIYMRQEGISVLNYLRFQGRLNVILYMQRRYEYMNSSLRLRSSAGRLHICSSIVVSVSILSPSFPDVCPLQPFYKFCSLHLSALVCTLDFNFFSLNNFPALLFDCDKACSNLICAKNNCKWHFVSFARCKLSRDFGFRFCEEVTL